MPNPPFRQTFDDAASPQAATNALGVQPGVHVVARNTSTGSSTIDGNLTVNGNTTLGNASTDTVIINAKSVTAPNLPMVLAFNSATDTNVTGSSGVATVDFDTEIIDRGGDFAADTFTAPITGGYAVGGCIDLTDLTASAGVVCTIEIITSNRTYLAAQVSGVSTTQLLLPYCAQVVDMDAGDTMTIGALVTGMAGNTADIAGNATTLVTFVSISLVG